MVLGLGSRSRKEGEAPLQLAEVEVHLHAIKPWQRGYAQSQGAMVLQWSRDERTMGSSREMACVRDEEEGRGIGAEKMMVDESFRVAVALTETSQQQKHRKSRMPMMKNKKTKRKSVDSPLVFHLFHGDNLKQQPLAQATLDLAAIAPFPYSPSPIAIPFTFSKTASSKGSASPYLHLSVMRLPNRYDPSSDAANVSMPHDGSDSDRVPMPTLDQETQRALVAALLSDEDDDASIASFTDEDNDDHISASNGALSAMKGGLRRSSEFFAASSQMKPTTTQSTVERQSGELKTITPFVARVFSVTRDAAVGASTVYSRKHSVLENEVNSLADKPNNADSDPDRLREDIGALPCDKTIIDNGTGQIHPILGKRANGTGQTIMVNGADKNPVTATGELANAEDLNTPILSTQRSLEARTVSRGHRGERQQEYSSQRFAISEEKYQKKNANGLQTNSFAKHLTKQQSPERTKRRTAAHNSGYVSMVLSKEWRGKGSKSKDADVDERKQRLEDVDERKQQLEDEVNILKGELGDVAALESAVYSTSAEHSCSSFKLHAPARRLARTYEHTHKYCSRERRAKCAKNIVTGLILASRACGNDVPRLTFWWSNAVLLREIISRTFNVFLPKADISTLMCSHTMKPQSTISVTDTNHQQQKPKLSNIPNFDDWVEPSTLMAALERLEGWIYAKVMESIWWQVFTPQMQKQVVSSHFQDNGADIIEDKSSGFEFGDDKQGSTSVELWKKAFLEACDRLCPVQRLAVKCGCLPMLKKMVLEACVVRLDVAMFNAVLRDNESPTDPISDPISDARVLPIPTRNLSFGVGAQLKNSVASLSTWLINVILKEYDDVETSTLEEDEKARTMFPLLKAIGGVLMIPKDMLLDESLRTEVCPLLSLSEIVTILSRFRPDEFCPEPVTPGLLRAMSSTSGVEDMNESVRLAPAVIYGSPDSGMVRHMITEILGKNSNRVPKKGHTSDDEIEELESSISWLLDNTQGITTRSQRKDKLAANGADDSERNCRFRLLGGIWAGPT